MDDPWNLSPSERRVMALWSEGLDVNAIADRVFRSASTVDTQIRSACVKMGEVSRHRAAVLWDRLSRQENASG